MRWQRGPAERSLRIGHVDVWRVRLGNVEPSVDSEILSPDESERAQRFHFEKDRLYFQHCRSKLRQILSVYLGIGPGEIRFEYEWNGKPRLFPGQNLFQLQFNVSHSDNIALIAVGRAHALGIDIEKIRQEVDINTMAERFLSARELDGLASLPGELRLLAFFACWTRKEAFLKATGFGLSYPLSDFSVTTDPGSRPTIREIKGDEDLAKMWSLMDIDVDEGYRAAVAVDHESPTLSTFE
jgi:4'-phosphopantetheinyl transferase